MQRQLLRFLSKRSALGLRLIGAAMGQTVCAMLVTTLVSSVCG